MPCGHERPLYILPFDHRGSFQTKLFGWKPPLSEAPTAEIAGAKRVIYDGFKSAISAGVPKDKAGILVDEQFGATIRRDAEVAWRNNKMTRDQAVAEIARRYREFADAFDKARSDTVRPA
jgi:myo-inositol catabolism protein IolC